MHNHPVTRKEALSLGHERMSLNHELAQNK